MRKIRITAWTVLAIFISVSILFVNTDIFAAETGMDGSIADDQAELRSTLESFETDIPYKDGGLIVGFREEANAPQESKEIAAQDAVQSSEIIDDSTVLVTVEEGQDVRDVVRDLAEDSDIAYIEPDYELSSCEDAEMYALSGDPYNLYHLDVLQIDGLWQRVSQSAVYVPTLAVIDTGCLLSHEDLRDVVDKELSVDVTARDSNGQYEKIQNLEVQDSGNHGTNVTSVASAMSNNDVGIAGVTSCYSNDKVRTVAVKIANEQGQFYISDLVKALNYAKELGVDVVNISVGTQAASASLHNKITEVYNSGIIMVTAAGNRPLSGYNQNSPTYPSDYDECISITSLSENLESSAFTRGYLYGPQKDFAAPGEQITTANNQSDSSYASASGTSYSSPMVASIVALLKTMQPDLTFQDVYEILKTTATDIYSESQGVAKGFDEYTGWGLVNATLAGCQLMGHSLYPADSGSEDETFVCTYCSRSFVKHPAVDATCETDGNVQYYYCPDTEQYFADDLCTQQMEAGSWVRNAKGHQWDDGQVTTAATCTEAGLKTYTCTVCEKTKTEPIPAMGHTDGSPVVENKVDATCERAGSFDEVVYCTVCGEELSRQQKTIEALGHDWGEWKVVKEATISEEGLEERVCKRDETHKETRPVEKKATVSIASATVTVPAQTYTGGELKPQVTVKLGTDILKEDRDYTISYSDNVNAGTAKVTVTGKGDYTGTAEQGFEIKAKAITPTVTLSPKSAKYDGTVKKPTVTVRNGTKKLKANTDYTVTFRNSSGKAVSSFKAAGTYTVAVKLKGNYSGSKTASFQITKAENTLKIKVSKKTCTVKALKKGKVTFNIGARNNQGKVTYTPNKAAKKAGIKVTSAGKVTVPKGCTAGTYKITVKAKGNKNYKEGKKTVTITVK